MSRPADEIFNDALDKTGEERDRFLAEACAGNAELRHEIDSLLEAYAASDVSLLPFFPPGVPKRIGAYTIESEIWRGGMGVVYRAQDEALNRRVALKVLPARLAREPAWLERFRREGRVLASFNHPNIATIHTLEEAAGLHFITMEWVDGETLAERIQGRPLPADDAMAICLQIAHALEAAHARGVAHRDLTPVNVKVRPDGHVKVLDFGLAKVFGETGAEAAPDPQSAPGGSLLAGTPGYMAPEQQQGATVDRLADIWAFGCILYEVFTGHPAMPEPAATERGPDVPRPPDWEALRRVAPPAILELATSAIEPDRERRLSDAASACRVLESELAAMRPRRWVRRPLVPALGSAAALVTLLVLWGVFQLSGGGRSKAPLLGSTANSQLTHSGAARLPEIRPDGGALAWIDGRSTLSLWTMELPDSTPRELQRFWSVTQLRWAPDGRSLLVAGVLTGAGPMKIVRVDTGNGSILGEYAYDPLIAWAPDGTRFVSAHTNGLPTITDLRTGESQPLLETPPWKQVLGLDWSPGRSIVVRAAGTPSEYVWIVSPENRSATPVPTLRELWSVRWTEGGTALFGVDAEENVWRLHMDPRTGRPRGKPERGFAIPGIGSLGFSCSDDGRRLAYPRGPARSNLWEFDVATGKATQLTHGTIDHQRARFSPNGQRILFTRRVRYSGSDAFILPSGGGDPVQVTALQTCSFPVWSPDGRQIAFRLIELSKPLIAVSAADGTGIRQFEGTESDGGLAWSPGRTIVFSAAGNQQIRELDVDTGTVRELYDCGPDFQVYQPRWAPDGRRLAAFEAPLHSLTPPGIIVLDPQTRSRTVVHIGIATPIGWSSDGRWLHLVARRAPPETTVRGIAALSAPASVDEIARPLLALLRVPAAGGAADTLALLPHPVNVWSSVDISPDGRRVVYAAADFISDIWMVEGLPR